MGNIEAQMKDKSLLKHNYMWKKQASLGYCDLVRDNVSAKLGQCYTCYIEDYGNHLNIYQFRKNNPKYIVTIYSVQKINSQYLCALQQGLRVVTERIPYRLPDLGHIGYNEGLYIINCCLKGSKIICRNHQKFQLDQNMICFNEKGQAKIWFNQNISLNIPQIFGDASQKEIISKIMQIVQNRMSGTKLNQYQHKKQLYNLDSFQIAQQFISQNIKQTDKVNFVTLPSMVAQNLSTPQLKIQTKLQKQLQSSLKYTQQSFKKLPKGLPPRPKRHNKQKSNSQQKSSNASNQQKNKNYYKSQPKPQLKLQKNKNIQQQKKNRLLSPQFNKKLSIIDSTLNTNKQQKFNSSRTQEGRIYIHYLNKQIQKQNYIKNKQMQRQQEKQKQRLIPIQSSKLKQKIIKFDQQKKQIQEKQQENNKEILNYTSVQKKKIIKYNHQNKQIQKKQQNKQSLKSSPIQQTKKGKLSIKQKKKLINNYFDPNYFNQKETKKHSKITHQPMKNLVDVKQINKPRNSGIKINFTFNPIASQ